jgi:hypothetical protein
MARVGTGILLFIALLIGPGLPAAAGEQMFLSLDVLELDQGFDGSKDHGQKPEDLGRQVDKRFALQCHKAVGDPRLCECLMHRRPWVVDFVEYVQLVGATKTELKYRTLDGRWKAIVDRARDARDECVSRMAKTPSK